MLLLNCFMATASSGFVEDASSAIEKFHIDCESPDWQLWPVSLCGPVLIVDAQRNAISNEPLPDFKKEGRYYAGLLPDNIPLANTAVDWLGKRRVVLMYPLPKDSLNAERLIAHEAFHRIQPKLSLPMREVSNPHLESIEGRYYLLLELRALKRARDKSDSGSLFDAWHFRNKRYQAFPEAKASEQALEINEGLAEYTGIKAVNQHSFEEAWFSQLGAIEQQGSLGRQFAYSSFPAWLLVLDKVGVDWKPKVSADFFVDDVVAERFAQDIELHSPSIERYQGSELLAELNRKEQERLKKREQLLASYQQHPIALPLQEMSMTFDPGGVTNLEPEGTHYKPLTISDHWGKLTSAQGGLISSDYQLLTLYCEPNDLSVHGKGINCGEHWQLDLKAGWLYDLKTREVTSRQ